MNEDNNELRAESVPAAVDPYTDQTFLNYSGLEVALDSLITKVLTLRTEMYHLAPETGDEVADDLLDAAELLALCKVTLLATLAMHLHNLRAGEHSAVPQVQREPNSGEG